MRNVLVGLILKYLRDAAPEWSALPDVLRDILPSECGPEGRIPKTTRAALIGGAILELSKAGLIELLSDGSGSLAQRLLTVRDEHAFSYDAAKLIKEAGEDDIKIRLADRFSTIQHLIGFSISDLVARNDENAITVVPAFRLDERRTKRRHQVFVLMPFSPAMKPVYTDHIAPTCVAAGLSCGRADELFSTDGVMQDIWSAIYGADWIVADCTGRNPNVFYELGISHVLGKRVIIITQDESDVPSDIRHIRYIKYDYTPRGAAELEQALKKTLEAGRDWTDWRHHKEV